MDTAFALGSTTRLSVKLLPSCWGFPTTFKALIRRIKTGGNFSISFPFTSGGHAHPDDSDTVAAVELRHGGYCGTENGNLEPGTSPACRSTCQFPWQWLNSQPNSSSSVKRCAPATRIQTPTSSSSSLDRYCFLLGRLPNVLFFGEDVT